ncbi:MAG: lipocalin family protein [Candidatus Moranbacteria bacterium]|nr:lipocalin family protein [Candidatus Moranbacteria bacterium]
MQKEYQPIQFPEDESAHDAIIEWWYFNGHLKDEKGNEYSYMDCLFKTDVKKVKIPFLSKIPLKTSYFSHSLVSDLKNKKFHHRITPFSIISDDSFSKNLLYVNYVNPEIRNGYSNCVIEKINESKYILKNEDIDLTLISAKTPLLEGGKGFCKLNSKATYYYSLTNLVTEGRIKIENKWIGVSGKSWMDHQWADVSYTKNRWDWFSVQLDNNTEMVCFMYDDGQKKTYLASISYPDNKQEHFEKVKIVPLPREWVSLKSKAKYPLLWKIKIPEKDIYLILSAKIENQEMLFGSINYWEGPLSVKGVFGDQEVNGVGFMELVGYSSKYNNVKYLRDEVGKTASKLISSIKNETFSIISNSKKHE